MGDEEGFVLAYRLSDGTQAWSHQLSGVIRGIGASDDVLFVGVLGGKVYALRP